MSNDIETGAPKPLTASDLHHWLQEASPPLLVDVREHSELAIAPFPSPVLHLPLSESQQWMAELETKLAGVEALVVICHAGVRSWHFGCWLLSRDPHRSVWNLSGGIDAWSVTVDPRVPRY